MKINKKALLGAIIISGIFLTLYVSSWAPTYWNYSSDSDSSSDDIGGMFGEEESGLFAEGLMRLQVGFSLLFFVCATILIYIVMIYIQKHYIINI